MVPAEEFENDLSLVRDTLWFRCILYGGFLITCSYMALVLPAHVPEDQVGILHLKGYFILIGLSIFLYWTYANLRNHLPKARGHLLAKSKIPSDSALPCSIRIYQGGVLTGGDDGYVWLAEGLIHYRGLQTAFRINRSEIPPMMFWKRGDKPDQNHLTHPLTIPFTEEDADCKLVITLIDPLQDYNRRSQVTQFRRKFVEWLDCLPTSDKNTVFPPLSVHPCFHFGSALLTESVVACTGLAFLVGLTSLWLLLAPQQNSTQLDFRWLALLVFAGVIYSLIRTIQIAKKTEAVRAYLRSKEQVDS